MTLIKAHRKKHNSKQPLSNSGFCFLNIKNCIQKTILNIPWMSPEMGGGAEVVIYTWHVSERPPKQTVRGPFSDTVSSKQYLCRSHQKKVPVWLSEESEAQIRNTPTSWHPQRWKKGKLRQVQVSGPNAALCTDQFELRCLQYSKEELVKYSSLGGCKAGKGILRK